MLLKEMIEDAKRASQEEGEEYYYGSDMDEWVEDVVKEDIQEILGDDFKPSGKEVLESRFLDFYNDKLKLGIVVNGNYIESLKVRAPKTLQKQTFEAIEKGIRLIHIPCYEWMKSEESKEKLTSLLKSLINNSQIVYARQCEVKEISSKQSVEFLDRYHLQGADRSTVKYGLFYDSELIGCMTFAKPRFNKNYQWELSRLCWHRDYRVVGGANRLFKHFIKENNPESVISYCDIGKFTGKVYEELGFKFQHYSSPNYVWFNEDGEVFKRYQCQRHKLIKAMPEFEGYSESEIMTALGFWKIEDCGNASYVWTNELYELRKETGNLTEY